MGARRDPRSTMARPASGPFTSSLPSVNYARLQYLMNETKTMPDLGRPKPDVFPVLGKCVVASILLAVVAVLLLLATASAQAASYECRPRDPNEARPPTVAPKFGNSPATITEEARVDNFHPLCAEGEVPYPTGPAVKAPKALRQQSPSIRSQSPEPPLTSSATNGAAPNRTPIGEYWYSWAGGKQNYIGGENVYAQGVRMTNEDPYVAWNAEAHSIAQLWAIQDATSPCFSDVETGWEVSPGQYSGSTAPHLFMYAWDCGVGLGYVGQSSIPWVQHSSNVFPMSVLPAGHTLHTYGVSLFEGNWWFKYDEEWVGYIPGSAWTRSFPASIWTTEVGGEVATPEYETCTDMGNGEYGNDPYAAIIWESWYEGIYGDQYNSLSPFNSDPEYTTGNLTQPWQFGYGGPGWC